MTTPKRRKTNGKTNGPRLVEQKHGGALKTGGTPGHKCAGGRPPSAVREAARLAFSERLEVLTAIADDEEERASDRLKAIDMLGKYGGVDSIALTTDEQPEQTVTPERIAEWWEQIERIKTVKGFEKMLTDVAQDQAANRG